MKEKTNKETEGKIKLQRMDISKLSNDDVQDAFTEAYQEQIANDNDIDSFECICKRSAGSSGTSETKMEVMIVGMAGSPSVDDYKGGKVRNSQYVTISRSDRGGVLKFKLEGVITLNVNDYIVTYKAI